MSDDKPKPIDDLKQGLELLFRAAKGAVETVAEKVPTEKIEAVAGDAVKEVGRALETVGTEFEKVVGSVMGQPAQPGSPPQTGHPGPPANAAPPAPASPPEPYDDAYAPEPANGNKGNGGPRVG